MEITLDNVSLVYSKNTPFEKRALHSITLTIKSKTINGIVGKNGSGKSTLTQIISGLLIPDEGFVRVDGKELTKKHLFSLRKQIGFVFQFPEHQIFQATVEDEISYGLKNFDYKKNEIDSHVKEAMNLLDLSYKRYASRSPFSLSGGEMRKVAIAGVIAYKPKLLILDEPTIGLDQKGRNDIINLLNRLNKEYGTTIIIVSHQMDEILGIADQVFMINEGRLEINASAKLFAEHLLLEKHGLDIPEKLELIKEVNKKFGVNIPLQCHSVEELVQHISATIKGKADEI